MCIIVVKNKGIDMPSEEILHQCWVSNPDGAGYMWAEDGRVHISKGYMIWSDFINSLNNEYNRLGKDTPMVMHFRIGTQGGNTPQNTHPFPLSKNMDELKYLDCSCSTGIAHNGIISLTTSYSTDIDPVTKSFVHIDYSDTMKFITDYMSLFMNRDWYNNSNVENLISRLAGSYNKFALLNYDGNLKLIGTFMPDDNGVLYSNMSYLPPVNKKFYSVSEYDRKKKLRWETRGEA